MKTKQTKQRAPGELADRVAAAVAACPSVVRLAAGPVATYLAGRTVEGVAVRADSVRVAVVARYGLPLSAVADQVRAAVWQEVPGLPVNVDIEDVQEGEMADG